MQNFDRQLKTSGELGHRGVGESQRAQGSWAVFLQLKLYSATTEYIQRMGKTLSNCNLSSVYFIPDIVLIILTLISFFRSPPLLPLFIKYLLRINVCGKRSMRKRGCIAHNIHSMYWLLTCHYRSWYPTVKLIQCWGHQGRFVAWSGKKTVTTSVFLMSRASHWALNRGRQSPYWVYYC